MRLVTALLLSFLQTPAPPAASELHLPEALAKCLQSGSLRVVARLVETRNPFYLRGDFDADGQADYAVIIRMAETAKDALLICEAVGGAVVLGGNADPKRAFSSIEGDNFVAPAWEALSIGEVRRVTAFTSNVPKPLTNQRGDAIAMIFEDAVELVFWNGRQYRHAPAEF